MSDPKACDHCGAGPDEPCPVGCTCGEPRDCIVPHEVIAIWDRVAADIARGTRTEVERLTRERDEARAEASIERAAANEWLAQLHDAKRERDAALRWSRLWHREARRLWAETQALGLTIQQSQQWEDGVVQAAREAHDHLMHGRAGIACETLRAALDPDQPAREVDAEEWLARLGGDR